MKSHPNKTVLAKPAKPTDTPCVILPNEASTALSNEASTVLSNQASTESPNGTSTTEPSSDAIPDVGVTVKIEGKFQQRARKITVSCTLYRYCNLYFYIVQILYFLLIFIIN